jgi:hypothetical protein
MGPWALLPACTVSAKRTERRVAAGVQSGAVAGPTAAAGALSCPSTGAGGAAPAAVLSHQRLNWLTPAGEAPAAASGELPLPASSAAAREALLQNAPCSSCLPCSAGEPRAWLVVAGEPNPPAVEGVRGMRRPWLPLLPRLPGVPLAVIEEVGVKAMDARPCRSVVGWGMREASKRMHQHKTLKEVL